MTKDNRLCLFKERYRFENCINCSGYGNSRIKECQHYLPKVEQEKMSPSERESYWDFIRSYNDGGVI